MLKDSDLDEEDLAEFAQVSFFPPMPMEQDPWMRNRGERNIMNSVAEELFEEMNLLAHELRRRFDNAAKVKDDESKPIGEQIKDAAIRYGYCQGMQHSMMLLEQLNVKSIIPEASEFPRIPAERKPEQEGALPKVDDSADVSSDPVPRTDGYEGDYVIVKGKKYYADDVMMLISEASILNPEMTKQGRKAETKIGKLRAMFPGMTDDEIIGLNYKELDNEHKKARSEIRDYRDKKKSQARTKAALMQAERDNA